MTRINVSGVIPAPIGRVWEIVRDYNGLPRWLAGIAASEIEGGQPADRIGAVRRLRLDEGQTLREKLLALDDLKHRVSYSMIETPLPIANYVAHVRLRPVTLTDQTFMELSSEFDVVRGPEEDMVTLLRDTVYTASFGKLAALMQK